MTTTRAKWLLLVSINFCAEAMKLLREPDTSLEERTALRRARDGYIKVIAQISKRLYRETLA